MTADTMTLVLSISALLVAGLFIAKLVKAAIQLAVVAGLIFLAYHFYPQIKSTACEKAPQFAGPIGICTN